MARPKKPRHINGIPLADNLYPDNRERPNHYRYRRGDGSMRSFTAPSVEAANQLAEQANDLRDSVIPQQGKPSPSRDQLAYHVPLYTAYQERLNPGLPAKDSWQNRKYALGKFAKHFDTLPIGQIQWDNIQTWWDELTPSQQKLRHAEFRRFFNWLMSQGLLPRLDYNPFTTADDRPRLLLKQPRKKGRRPLVLKDYWKVYKKAAEMNYPGLQIAMALSLYTSYRREDIVTLRWDTNLVDRKLRLVIGKSEAQKGSARAARHAWDLDEHPILSRIIQRARELSLENARCPYVVSQWPQRKHKGPDGAAAKKDHIARVLPDRLTRMYAEVAHEAGVHGTSFHEIRGLSSTLHRLAGYTNEQIQELMAHESPATTIDYQDGDALPFSPMDLVLPDKILDGEF